MRILGLTGGIGSGKSTVSNLFKAHGIPVVDADIVARDVLKKGSGGWKKVVTAFGQEILQPDGEVDRPKLGRIVFSDLDKRQLLNRLLAPYISSGIFQEILKLWIKASATCVKNGTSEEEAKNRINAQMPLGVKRSKADIVIDNTGSLDDMNEHFRMALAEVTKPLTWTEFGLSRQGAFLAFISIFLGVILCKL